MISVLESATKTMVKQLELLSFSAPVSHVYNPLDYAWLPHQQYLERFASGKKKVLFLGMNPGPFGMAQTGVPFGEVAAVSDWMKIHALVGTPEKMHPKRPIQGFGCAKSEVSGRRLWGYFAEKFPKAEDFFSSCYVNNYCPLIWMAETGRNLTPDKIAKEEMQPVEEICNAYLAVLIQEQQPDFLLGVGAYAEKKLRQVANNIKYEKAKIGKILHPSPASPLANKGWAEQAHRQLIDLGIVF